MTARRSGLVAFLLVMLVVAVACAVNPATGKRQLSFVSESKEIEMGRENDTAIVEQMGLVDDDVLQRYVQNLGRRLAALSERPDLEWTFRVVDDPIVNAFALPGGYIYITRGILANLQNEAELATVVGHEIGHVTARHSVNQISKSQLAQLGLGASAIVAPEYATAFGGLAETGLGLLFLKYGRDDERQADDLGLRYVLRADYDPRPAAGVFDTLTRVSQAGGGDRAPAWSSTHPAPENRKVRIEQQIDALNQDFSGRPVGEESYRRRIDHLVYGEDPRQGYFSGDVFVHPEMEFRISFPDGWKRRNQRSAVVAVNRDGNAAIQLSLARGSSAEAAFRAFFSREGIGRKGQSMSSINGLPTAGDGFVANLGGGTVEGRVGFVELDGRVFELVGYATDAAWPSQEKTVRSSLASFERLTDRRFLDVEPKRLRFVPIGRDMTVNEFADAFDASVQPKTLAQINRLDAGEPLRAGGTYKVVVGGRLP
jgi:predicted Zn-dependent protease